MPGIIELLEHENPTLRGDAIYVLGTIKGTPARGPLNHALYDENAQNETLYMMRLPRPPDQVGGQDRRERSLRDIHGSHPVGNEDTEEKKRAGNSYEGKEEVNCLFCGRFVHCSDGSIID